MKNRDSDIRLWPVICMSASLACFSIQRSREIGVISVEAFDHRMRRFKIRTLLIFVSVVAMFLSLNVFPWRSQCAIYVDGSPPYFPMVDRYGWPYAYLHRYVDADLPRDITQWSMIDDNRLFHTFDNAIICAALSVLLTLLIAWAIRSRETRTAI